MRRAPLGERPTRRKDLPAWYAAALERQATSGLSMTQFAASIGVPAVTLYQWRQRIAGATAESMDPLRFVEVDVVPPAAPETPTTSIRVELRSGHHLVIGPGFQGDHLRRLLEVLESC
jgi:hypothetical protein